MVPLLRVGDKLRHVSGWQPDTKDSRDKFMAAMRNAALPKNVSLRNLCPPIRDQGRLGTCTTNSSCEAMGFLYTKDQKQDPIFSRLFSYYYSRTEEGVPASVDSGCRIRDVMKVLATYGSPLEATWPYDESMFSVEPSLNAQNEAKNHRVLFYYRCPDLFTAKASIAQGFPVIFGFFVPANFISDECTRTGVVKYPEPAEAFYGGHAVLAVGYDDDLGLVCFQNSWGEDWGDRGFGYMPYKMFTDGFVKDCWTIRREEM